MKIGVISAVNGINWGGSEELWATMVNDALHEGLKVALSICYDASIPIKFAEIQRNRVEVFRRRPLYWRRAEKVIAKIASPFRKIFDWKPDVICISLGSTYDFLYFSDLLALLYSSGVPYIVVCQYNDNSVVPEHSRNLAEVFFKRAARVAFVAQQNLITVERQLARKLSNAVVLQNPVNLSDLTAVAWPSLRPITMASVARLAAKYKGQDILFEVLGSPIWRSREWRVHLYGAGQDREYLQALAQHYGIAQNVEFCGHVDDIRSIWELNHLLVLPSRGEGTPLALVEAMLCGRPAVVTDVGGNAEWIDDGRTGFVAEAATAKSFGVALERAWLAQANWAAIGNKARQTALDRFDKSTGKSLLKVLLDATSPSPSNLFSTYTRARETPFSVELSGHSGT